MAFKGPFKFGSLSNLQRRKKILHCKREQFFITPSLKFITFKCYKKGEQCLPYKKNFSEHRGDCSHFSKYYLLNSILFIFTIVTVS